MEKNDMFITQIIDKMSAYGHVAGLPIECLSIAVELHKEQLVDENGQQVSYHIVHILLF